MRSDGRGGRHRSRGRYACALAVLLAGLAASLALTGPSAGAQVERGGDPPNVVVIMTDDQRVDDTKVMRQVRRLITRRGTTFRNAYATFPLCCPSRASYFTGQYAHNHGVLGNTPPNGGVTRLDDTSTIATDLDGAGYRTGLIGKYLNGYPGYWRASGHLPPGYDVWQPIVTTYSAYGWRQLIDGEEVEWGGGKRSYATDVYAREAKAFIRDSAKDVAPFFLTVVPNAPHVERGSRSPRYNPRPARRHKDILEGYPFPEPAAFNEADLSDKPSFISDNARVVRRQVKQQRLARLESLLAVDDLVNSVIRTLKTQGALSNTLVVFTSDNGFQYGEHRLAAKNVVYEESIRVPLVARGPGMPAGTTVRSPAANIDVPATIYDLTGVEPTLTLDGVSLYDLIGDPAFADRDLLIETQLSGTAPRTSQAVRTRRYLYAEHDTDLDPATAPELELYDLRNDPYELESLHDDPDFADLRAELADRLDELRDCAGASCR